MSRTAEIDTAEVSVERLAAATSLDRVIFGSRDVHAMDAASLADDQLGWFRQAVVHHLEDCDPYRRFAARRGFDVERLQTISDLASVPQVPTSVFKHRSLLTPGSEPTTAFRSSGTQGVESVVHRDKTTLLRLSGSMRASLGLLDPVVTPEHRVEDDCVVVNLGPPRAAVDGIWFAYVMSLVELVVPTHHLFTAGGPQPEALAPLLGELLAQGKRVGVFGPPALLRRAALAAAASGRPVGGDDVLVLSAGGWKLASGAAVDRQVFTEQMIEGFGLAGPSQVRDAFSQVELNAVFVECREHRKHVPPWVVVLPRDPETLQPLLPGQTGLLTFLDASTTSYPCFVVGDDLGRLDDTPCACGRHSSTVVVERRVERSGRAGCATKIERLA